MFDYLYIPDFAGFPGGENVDYWVDWDGKERQLSSMNDYRYEDLSQAVAGCAEDVSCRIRIKDRFGFVWESNEVTYESMIPEAVPELTLGNTVDVVGEVGDEMGQGFHLKNIILTVSIGCKDIRDIQQRFDDIYILYIRSIPAKISWSMDGYEHYLIPSGMLVSINKIFRRPDLISNQAILGR